MTTGDYENGRVNNHWFFCFAGTLLGFVLVNVPEFLSFEVRGICKRLIVDLIVEAILPDFSVENGLELGCLAHRVLVSDPSPEQRPVAVLPVDRLRFFAVVLVSPAFQARLVDQTVFLLVLCRDLSLGFQFFPNIGCSVDLAVFVSQRFGQTPDQSTLGLLLLHGL